VEGRDRLLHIRRTYVVHPLLDAGEQKKKEEMIRATVFHGAFDIQVEQIPDVVRLLTLPVTRILVSIAHFGRTREAVYLDIKKIARTVSMHTINRTLNRRRFLHTKVNDACRYAV
jgi:hypothetical protein